MDSLGIFTAGAVAGVLIYWVWSKLGDWMDRVKKKEEELIEYVSDYFEKGRRSI